MSKPEEVEISHLMMDVADMMAEGAQPSDSRSWRHLLIYCPRELLEARIAELDRSRLKKIALDIDDVTSIAVSSGNYDVNPYMHGMANGLLLAQAIVKGEEVQYLETPEIWLDDKKGEHHSAETMGDMGTVSQAAGGSRRGSRAYDADREARARASRDYFEGDQQGSGDPPDSTPG